MDNSTINSKPHTTKTPCNRIFYIDCMITICLMLVIFWFSAQSADDSSAMSDGIAFQVIQFLRKVLPEVTMDLVTFAVRKLAHFSEYTLLGIFLTRTIHDLKLRPCLAWAIGALYSVTDEFHQFFVPGRSCEIRDMCIDSAGVLLGVLLVWIFSKRKKQ